MTTEIPVKVERDGENVWISPSGAILLSVTQVIQKAGLMTYRSSPIDNPWVERGTKVHACIEALNDGKEPPTDSLTTETAPFVLGYDTFLKDSGFQVLSQEQRVWDDRMGVCGQYDLFGLFPHSKRQALVDIKTGKPAKWHPIQTAGYFILLDLFQCDRYALYLDEKGQYQLKKHEDENDFAVFRACVDVARWKHLHKVK